MIFNLSTKIITCFEKRGLISDDKEIIIYGLFFLLFNVYCFILCLIIGIVIKLVFESCIFYFSFLFIKKYSGGYHASKEWKCAVLSAIGIFTSLVMLYGCFETLYVYCFIKPLFMISGLILYLATPLESENKPLEPFEKQKYKKFFLVRISLINILLIFSIFKELKWMAAPIMISEIFDATILVMGIVQKYRRTKKRI